MLSKAKTIIAYFFKFDNRQGILLISRVGNKVCTSSSSSLQPDWSISILVFLLRENLSIRIFRRLNHTSLHLHSKFHIEMFLSRLWHVALSLEKFD